jgi:hypothetical protein
VVLPVLVVVLVAAIWALGCVAAQLRCVDAAGLAARAAARGEPAAVVGRTGRAAAPSGARVAVRSGAAQVEVVVSATVHPLPGVLSRLPGVPVRGRAVAAREDVPP